jgi:hypothetical protein
MSKDSSNILIGGALIIGAVMYSRNAAAHAAAARPAAAPLPGSAGSGVGQVLGGALGSFLQGLTRGGAQQGTTPQSVAGMQNFFKQFSQQDFVPTALPDYNAAYQANPELLQNMMNFGI